MAVLHYQYHSFTLPQCHVIVSLFDVRGRNGAPGTKHMEGPQLVAPGLSRHFLHSVTMSQCHSVTVSLCHLVVCRRGGPPVVVPVGGAGPRGRAVGPHLQENERTTSSAAKHSSAPRGHLQQPQKHPGTDGAVTLLFCAVLFCAVLLCCSAPHCAVLYLTVHTVQPRLHCVLH